MIDITNRKKILKDEGAVYYMEHPFQIAKSGLIINVIA